MSKDLETAISVVEAYQKLLYRALKIVSDVPYRASIDDRDRTFLDFDGDEAILLWVEYESDYYGGGHLETRSTRFPASVLFLSDDELAALRRKVKKEEAERDAKLRAAQAAVARDRQEAHDRAEFARLSAKFGAKA